MKTKHDIVAFCTECVTQIEFISSSLDVEAGRSIEPEEIDILKEMVPFAKKQGQVKGSKMAWMHKMPTEKGYRFVWLVFHQAKGGTSVNAFDKCPDWVTGPDKPQWVSMLVPLSMRGDIARMIAKEQNKAKVEEVTA